MEKERQNFDFFTGNVLQGFLKLLGGAHTPEYGYSYQTLLAHIIEAGSVAYYLLDLLEERKDEYEKLVLLGVLVHDLNKKMGRMKTQQVSDDEIKYFIKEMGFENWYDELDKKYPNLISHLRNFAQERNKREGAFFSTLLSKLSGEIPDFLLDVVRSADNIATSPKVFKGEFINPAGEIELLEEAGKKILNFLSDMAKKFEKFKNKNYYVYCYFVKNIRGALSQILLPIFEDFISENRGEMLFFSSIGGVFISENKINFKREDIITKLEGRILEMIKGYFLGENEVRRFIERRNAGTRLLPFGYLFGPKAVAIGISEFSDQIAKKKKVNTEKEMRFEFLNSVLEAIWWACDELIGEKEGRELFQKLVAEKFFAGDEKPVLECIGKAKEEKKEKRSPKPPVDKLALELAQKYSGKGFSSFKEEVENLLEDIFGKIMDSRKKDILHFNFIINEFLESLEVRCVSDGEQISFYSSSLQNIKSGEDFKPSDPNKLRFCSLCNAEIPQDFDSSAKSDIVGTETWVYSFRILPRKRRTKKAKDKIIEDGALQGAGTRICPSCLAEFSLRNIERENRIFVFAFPSSIFAPSFIPYKVLEMSKFGDLFNITGNFVEKGNLNFLSESLNDLESYENHFLLKGFEEDGFVGVLTASIYAGIMALFGFRCVVSSNPTIPIDEIPYIPLRVEIKDMLFSSLLNFIFSRNSDSLKIEENIEFSKIEDVKDFLEFSLSLVYLSSELTNIRRTEKKDTLLRTCRKVISNDLGVFSVLEDILKEKGISSKLISCATKIEYFIKKRKEGGETIMIVEEIAKKIKEIYDIAGVRISFQPSKHELTYLLRIMFDVVKKKEEYLSQSEKLDEQDIKEYIKGKVFSAVRRRTRWKNEETEAELTKKCSELVDIFWSFCGRKSEVLKQQNLLVDAVYYKLYQFYQEGRQKFSEFQSKVEELLKNGEVEKGDIIAFRYSGEVAEKGKDFIDVVRKAMNKFPGEKFFFIRVGEEFRISVLLAEEYEVNKK